MFQLILALFILVPLVEIYVLIEVGGVVGPLTTVALCIATAVLGTTLLRAQGLATLGRVQGMLDRGEVPAVEVLEAAVLLLAGIFLLTPGFLTDAIGFACLVPPLRRAFLLRVLERRILAARTRPPTGQPRVIEGEFERRDDDRTG